MDAQEIERRMAALRAEIDDLEVALAELQAADGVLDVQVRTDRIDSVLEGSIYGVTARQIAAGIDAPVAVVLERLHQLRDCGQAHLVVTEAGARWRWVFHEDQHKLSPLSSHQAEEETLSQDDPATAG